MPWAVRACAAASREAALWAAALGLHFLAALAAAWLIAGPRPSAPSPRLMADSIELTLAETESLTPVAPAEAARPAARPLPIPEAAPYLTGGAEAPVALPPPPPLAVPATPDLLPAPPLPPAWAPERATLPEIALPPAREAPAAEEARAAAGDTARLERKPRLLTDLTRLRKSYPAVARRNGWEGTVVLDLRVNADGTLAEAAIHASSGHDVLDRAALRMIRGARFANGPGRLIQPIEYRLR